MKSKKNDIDFDDIKINILSGLFYIGIVAAFIGFASVLTHLILSDGERHRVPWYAALASIIPMDIAGIMLVGGLVLCGIAWAIIKKKE